MPAATRCWNVLLMAVRHFVGHDKMRKHGIGGLAVLDLGEDVSSVWSPATGVRSNPSRVAIDAYGQVRGFGFDADLLASEPGRHLTATGLFGARPSRSYLVTSFLAWLMECADVAFYDGMPVFLPVLPTSSCPEHDLVRQAVDEMGGDAQVIHRPLAAAVAFDLEVDQPVCHLLAEVSEDHIDIAVVGAGSVVMSRRVARRDHAWIRSIIGETLRTLDPDGELEIRAEGVYLYGWSAPLHAAGALAAMDLPLAAPVGMGPTVLNGARVMAEAVLPWLLASR